MSKGLLKRLPFILGPGSSKAGRHPITPNLRRS
jgi:hypothetical protein